MAETKRFESGMERSADVEHLDYTSIHPIFLISLARTLAEGATKYGKSNWEAGCSVDDNLNHVLGHIVMYLAGDRSEPHLSHAGAGLMFAVVNDTLNPEMNAHYRRDPGCVVTDAMKDHWQAGRPDRQRKRQAGEFDHLGEWKLEDVPEIKRILEQRKTP